MPDISCLLLTLYLPIAFTLLCLLQPIGIPREILPNLAAAVSLGEPPGAVGARSEIERFKEGIARERLLTDVALALQHTEVRAVHNHKRVAGTREDVEPTAVEGISLICLAYRRTETEVGKELLENVHSV